MLPSSSASSKFRIKPVLGVICAASCFAFALPLFSAANSQAGAGIDIPSAGAGVAARSRYTIVLKGDPLAAYSGGVAGIAPAPQRSSGRLDVHAPSAQAYVAYLAHGQAGFLDELSSQLGRRVDPVATMQHALDAVIVELDDHEAAIAARRADVALVDRERTLPLMTDRAPGFVGAPQIWDGTASGGVLSEGEGVVVAVLDTGINWRSPAFAAVGPVDGYVHVNPNGAGNYLGLCGPTPPNADLGHCNDKLIGMYDFTSTADTRSATDHVGHGSHTSGTFAGNHWQALFGGGTFTFSGIAPHANLIAYRVCAGSGCDSSAAAQAIDQAVIDGVDVINFSVGGGTSPWTDPVSIAFRNAVGAGIFVAAAAGYNGPAAGTSNHAEPWVETVAASTKDNVLAFQFNLTGPGTPPANTQNLPLRPAAPPLPAASLVDQPIVQSPNFDAGSDDGCSPYPFDTFTVPGVAIADQIFAADFEWPIGPGRAHAIAVIHYDGDTSTCSDIVRREAAQRAGASGVIFVGTGFLDLQVSGASWSMLASDWAFVQPVILGDPDNATASLLLPASSYAQPGDIVAQFSGRGPIDTGGQYVVKPDISGPGVNIVAAYTADLGGASSTAMQTGTSMSAPNIAGGAALLRAVHPDWSPTQIRSAINMTASVALIRPDAIPVNAWDIGSGRIDLTKAALSGLVLDETLVNFAAADPGSGGNLASLNLAQIASADCAISCTFTRTVRSTSIASQHYTLSIGVLVAATVSPTSFSIAAGDTQVITLTVDGTQLASGWNFGQLRLVSDDVASPVLRMPIAINH